MGVMVGQWPGANAANCIDKLILSNTSSYFPDKANKAMWDARIKLLRGKGLMEIADAVGSGADAADASFQRADTETRE